MSYCNNCSNKHSGFSGQAMTEYTCKKCGKTYVNGNTDTPNYCPSCANKYDICEDCGKTLHTHHTLKILYEYGKEVNKGTKTFELRFNNRNFQVDDRVKFKVVDADKVSIFSGVKEIIDEFESKEYIITYVLKDVSKYGLMDGYCIFGIKEVKYE